MAYMFSSFRKTQEKTQENKKHKNVYRGVTINVSTLTISQPISVGGKAYIHNAFSISKS